MFMPKISIIIPCYNVSEYIDRCLTSIVTQTIGIESLEIICIDDASTDNTWYKLQQWEQKFPEQIMLIHCDSNGRQGTARNIGLTYVSSPWVTFIDSDDWIEPNYFEKLYGITVHIDCDVIVCQVERDSSTSLSFFKDRTTNKKSRYMIIDDIEKRKTFILLQCMNHLACGKLIKTSLLLENNIYFPENLTYEDTFFGSLLHFYVKKIFILEEKLYHYFINPKSSVLQTDSAHHLDLLTVQSMLWREWEYRGFFDLYRDVLEYDFLYSCYLRFMKVIVFRYQKPSYSLYLLLKSFILQKMPDFSQNYYLNHIEQPELYKFLFHSLSLTLNKEEFSEFASHIKSIGM